MCIDKKHPEQKQKRKYRQPGIIENFLADSKQESISLDLYPREIRRFTFKYPELIIIKEKKYDNMDIWKCTLQKKEKK